MRHVDIWIGIERVVAALWVGGIWGVGYLAVPVLFHSLQDHVVAGELAGQMFHLINGLGLICGAILILSAAMRGGLFQRRIGVILLMMVAAALVFFVLQPQMAAIKTQISGTTTPEFGRLHATSSIIYLIASLLGVWLVAVDSIRHGRH